MTINRTATAQNDAPREAMAHRPPGASRPPTLVTTGLKRAQVAMTLCADETDPAAIVKTLAEEAFLVTLSLATDSFHDPAPYRRPALEPQHVDGGIRIVTLERNTSAFVGSLAGSLIFHIPRTVLDGLSDELRGPRIQDLCCPPGTVDPVLAHLGAALLPAFEKPAAHAPFVDQLTRTIIAHLLHRYGGFHPHRAIAKGGLSLARERRAKAYLAKHHDDDIRLADVARECSLSRGHFIRAFRLTTGFTPGQWLTQYRLEKAKSLLRTSSIAIAEIADRCGFADQSHLTRVFTAALGVPPGAWRRQCRI